MLPSSVIVSLVSSYCRESPQGPCALFGAKGDGSTTAIQAAFDSVGASGEELYFLLVPT